MQIDKTIKESIVNHKQKIELTQWSIISSIASLVYSDYIKHMKQKEFPTKVILVPSIKSVRRLLDINGSFMSLLSEHLIDNISRNPLFEKYKSAPEFAMFSDDNIEIMKAIFNLYIIPNIIRRIPETIDKKFGISDETQQLFREDRDIEIIDGVSIDQYNYIVEETVLQLLALIPTMKRNIEIPEGNIGIQMESDEVIMINHDNAICPIYFNTSIIETSSIMELFQFVTSTTFKRIDDEETFRYYVDTSTSNRIALLSFEGISIA